MGGEMLGIGALAGLVSDMGPQCTATRQQVRNNDPPPRPFPLHAVFTHVAYPMPSLDLLPGHFVTKETRILTRIPPIVESPRGFWFPRHERRKKKLSPPFPRPFGPLCPHHLVHIASFNPINPLSCLSLSSHSSRTSFNSPVLPTSPSTPSR